MATNDLDLLQQYTKGGAQGAFAELVRRHLDMVYSVALRQVRSPALAEEVAQAVFVELARSARKMRPDSILAAWLYQVARRKAIDTVRKEARRQVREQAAVALAKTAAAPSVWEEIEPLLDEAMESLEEDERSSVLLRYFENKSLREVGEILGASEDAAQKRVSRAVDRLRGFFQRRGVAVGTSGLIAVLAANAVQSAPAALAPAIATLACSGAAVATAAGLVKILSLTTVQKALVGAVVVAGAGAGVYETYRASALQQQLDAASQPPAVAVPARPGETSDALAALRQENAALRGEIDRLQRDSRLLAQWQASEEQAAKDPSQKAMLSWLNRVDRLGQRLWQTPGAQIPELKLLSDQDWLEATATNFLESEDDYLKALAHLRRVSEKKFIRHVQSALEQYGQDRGGEFPTNLAQLRPYLEVSVDDLMLQAWTIVPNTKPWMGGEWLVTRKNLADPKRDIVWSFNARRSAARPGGLDAAYGQIAALRPVVQAYIRANHGIRPIHPYQLLSYVTTPEQKSLVQQMLQTGVLPQ